MSTPEPTITCPHCSGAIKLTESLAGPLVAQTKAAYEKQLRTETTRIATEQKAAARQEIALEVTQANQKIVDLQQVLQARDEKLREAQAAQAEFERKSRELDDQRRELALTVERQVRDQVQIARDAARIEADQAAAGRLAEREEQIASMNRTIEDLKRKAEQGSQQLQGEVQELELERALVAAFPIDQIAPVPKGAFGGDIVHGVVGPCGPCGSILWESKRTKTWSDGWLAKLRDDQRAAKADVAIIVTAAMPKGVEGFALVEGVWVTTPALAVKIAFAIRGGMIEVALARLAGQGQETKAALVYSYLTGPRFSRRVQAIVEAFTTMREDLDRERKAITKQWAKREEQIERVMQSTAGMYGDLQGIAGLAVAEIEGLDLNLLETSTSNQEIMKS